MCFNLITIQLAKVYSMVLMTGMILLAETPQTKPKEESKTGEEKIVQVPTTRSPASAAEPASLPNKTVLGVESVKMVPTTQSVSETDDLRPKSKDLGDQLVLTNEQLFAQASLVEWDSENQTIRFMKGELSAPGFLHIQSSAPEAAIRFLAHHKDVFKLDAPETELALETTWTDELGLTHVRFRQVYDKTEVWGSALEVHFSALGSVQTVNGHYFPSVKAHLNKEPGLAAAHAVQVVAQGLGKPETETETKLVLFPRNGEFVLAWEVVVVSPGDPKAVYVVDANSGSVLKIHR